jgi:hypothetical protein
MLGEKFSEELGFSLLLDFARSGCSSFLRHGSEIDSSQGEKGSKLQYQALPVSMSHTFFSFFFFFVARY